MSILLNNDELELLAGQPANLWHFYIVVKKYMDYTTGEVGKSWGVSWNTIQMQMHVNPRPGLKGAGTPSVQQVRSLADRAERIGLLKCRSEERRLVFFLPIARTLQQADSVTDSDFLAQNKVNRVSTVSQSCEVNISESSNGAACEPKKAKSQQTRKRTKSAELNTILSINVSKKEEVLTHLSATAPTDAPLSAKRRPVDVDASTDIVVSEQRKPTAVETVFAYWQQVMGKQTAKLDAKRTKAIAGRLKDGYQIEDLCRAIDGCKSSEWHQGKNDRHRAFNDIELICRDGSHVDGFRERIADHQAVTADMDDWLTGGDEYGQCFDAEYTVCASAVAEGDFYAAGY